MPLTKTTFLGADDTGTGALTLIAGVSCVDFVGDVEVKSCVLLPSNVSPTFTTDWTHASGKQNHKQNMYTQPNTYEGIHTHKLKQYACIHRLELLKRMISEYLNFMNIHLIYYINNSYTIHIT